MTATYFGFNPPFTGGAQNILSRQEDDRLIKNDILQTLMTVPGERVMRPEFGVNLRNFVFEPMTEQDLSSLREEIRDKVANDPRIIVRSVNLERDDDNNRLNIKIIVVMRKDPKRRLTIEQSLDVAASS